MRRMPEQRSGTSSPSSASTTRPRSPRGTHTFIPIFGPVHATPHASPDLEPAHEHPGVQGRTLQHDPVREVIEHGHVAAGAGRAVESHPAGAVREDLEAHYVRLTAGDGGIHCSRRPITGRPYTASPTTPVDGRMTVLDGPMTRAWLHWYHGSRRSTCRPYSQRHART